MSLQAPNAAVYWFCPTAVSHMAGILLSRVMQCLALQPTEVCIAQQKPIGVTADTKGCCFVVVPNSSQPHGRHFALESDAVLGTLVRSVRHTGKS